LNDIFRDAFEWSGDLRLVDLFAIFRFHQNLMNLLLSLTEITFACGRPLPLTINSTGRLIPYIFNGPTTWLESVTYGLTESQARQKLI